MLKPPEDSDPNALFKHALSLQDSGNVKDAVELYKQLLDQFPNNPNLLTAYGIALVLLESSVEGIQLLEKSLEISLDQSIAHFYIGYALADLKLFDKALTSCNHAIALRSDYADAYSNRANILITLKRFDEALISCDHAISLNPNLAEAHNNRGVILNELKQFDESMWSYEQAISLKPDYAEAYWNNSLNKLILGDFKQGWKLHEWRWKSFIKEHVREFSKPLWLGDTSISGKTILIYGEQGFGDVIQFCCYINMVSDLGANIIVEVRSSLLSLMATLRDDIIVIEKGETLPAFDFQCPIMSLPLAFKTTVETIPSDIPYLFCDPNKQKIWKDRLGAKTKKRIGFVCSGSTMHKDDKKRSIPLHLLKPLLELPFEFHLLQKEIQSDEKAFLAEHLYIKTQQENLADFADTAALINEMDLIISVDTSVAHLAGALGKTVWILLAWKADWRWLLDRTDSPWYPTATLFRQSEMGSWEGVIADICQKLSTRAEDYFYQGNDFYNLKYFEKALASYESAISVNPNIAEVYNNRGTVLNELKRFEEATLNYDQAISLKPDFYDAYWNKALVELVLGNYKLGWQLFEWRWKSFLKEHVREFSEPLWLGDASISGKIILIYGEQGFGDIIQLCRYIHMIKDLGAVF